MSLPNNDVLNKSPEATQQHVDKLLALLTDLGAGMTNEEAQIWVQDLLDTGFIKPLIRMNGDDIKRAVRARMEDARIAHNQLDREQENHYINEARSMVYQWVTTVAKDIDVATIVELMRICEKEIA